MTASVYTMQAAKAFRVSALFSQLHYVCKQRACAQRELLQALSCILEGAYGVVGFSRVKDERKGVFVADAVRRRADSAITSAKRPQIACKQAAERLLIECR